MGRFARPLALGILMFLTIQSSVSAQSVYHLHTETASNGGHLLSTAPPDAAFTSWTSAGLKGLTGWQSLAYFNTNPGDPNLSQTIPAGTPFQFSFWMVKSASSGTIYPAVQVWALNPDGTSNLVLGVSYNSSTPITTTLTKYTFTVNLPTAFTMSSTQKWQILTGVYICTKPTSAVTASIYYEGVLNGNYDSTATLLQGPSISSLTPQNGSIGSAVTIAGSGFGSSQGTGIVTFNGIQAAISSWTNTTIGVTVPGGASSGNVVVTTNAGAASGGVYFSVPAPSVTSVSPGSARVGAPVIISGSNFGSSRGTVSFNGVAAATTSWSDTSISTAVPVGATNGPISINTISTGINFNIIPNPTISGISPSSGPANTLVTVSGVGFGIPQGTGQITFGGVVAVPTSWSDATIQVPAPSGTTGGAVVVQAGGVNSNNNFSFSVTPAPTVTGLSPSSGAAGATVTISGSNFGSAQGTSVVRFNGQAANVNTWATGSISAAAPNGVTTGPVTVTVSAQTSNANVIFTAVTTGTLSGTVMNGGGTGISGATVQALQNGSVRATATTLSNGTYSIANINVGTYDLQVSASGFGTALQNALSITGGQTTTANVSLSSPSTISGTVTASDGVTPISGASVQLFEGSAAGATTTTNVNGQYSLGGLNGGSSVSYSVQASAAGYVSKTQSVSLPGGTTVTTNFALQATGVNAISYVYDELGRLKSVIDAAGDTATYSYDAVGNILSISRYNSAQLSIISFTPGSGPIGTTVTINGTAFSPTPSQNTVTFNNTPAAVSSASATQIVVTVPAGATTGPISVTVSGATANSSTNFSVAATDAPIVTGLSPTQGTAGTAVTITGTNFDSNIASDRVTLNASSPIYPSSASSTQLSVVVPANTGSGRFTVGTAVPPAAVSQDFYIPFGSHVPSDIGYTGRFAVGSSQTVAISASGKIGLLLFDGTAGQGVSLQLSGSTFSNCTLYILNPNGTAIASSSCTSGSSFVPSVTLPSSGTYTIGIDPGSSTGSVTIGSLADFTGTITVPSPGQTGPAVRVPTSGNLAVGQNGILTFTGSSGQKLSFNVIGSTFSSCTLTIYYPNGSSLGSYGCASGTTFIDTVSLTATGTYSINIHSVSSTGSLSLSVNNVADVTGTITIDGSPVTVTTTLPGQDARLTFSGTAAQRIVVYATNVTTPVAFVWLVDPNGGQVVRLPVNNAPAGQTFYLDTQTLALTGTYQLWVQHSGTYVGSETLQIASVPADFTGTLTVPSPGQTGPAVRVPTSGNLAAGQNATLTFNASAGQKLSFNEIGSTFSSCTLTIYYPNGSSLGNYGCTSGTTFIDTITFTVTGTYSILINPGGTSTGSLSLSVNNVADVTGTITIDGSPVTVTTTLPGQDARLTFSGTAAQRIVVYATNVTTPVAFVWLVDPNGGQVVRLPVNNAPAGQTFYLDTQTLALTGTYQLWVQHSGTYVGSETLQIASVPADFTGTLTVPSPGQTGPAVRVPTSGNLAAGQNATLTFNASSGQKLSFNEIGSTFSSCTLTIYYPNGSSLGNYGCTSGTTFIDTITFTVTGTYSILINPGGTSTGSLSLSVNNVADVTGTITIDGSPVTVTTTLPGQDARLTFSGTAAQRIVVYATNVTAPVAFVWLVDPNGGQVVRLPVNNAPAGQTFYLDTQTLALTGTYQLWVQHSGTYVGSETLQIASVPADVSSTLTIGGSAYAFTTKAGQNAVLTFNNPQSQSVTVHWTSGTYPTTPGCNVIVKNPSGTQIGSGSCTAATGTIGLGTQASGTYTITVDPQQQSAGGLSISVTTP